MDLSSTSLQNNLKYYICNYSCAQYFLVKQKIGYSVEVNVSSYFLTYIFQLQLYMELQPAMRLKK